jgi:nucleotide-binding universal stress UspA family protein
MALDARPTIRLLHVGARPPAQFDNFPVDLRNGDVVETILQVAADMKANLIAMATAGHQGLLDAIRGSTTERVLRQAPCPVLAIPVTDTL